MAIDLPPWLQSATAYLDLRWPSTSEDVLAEWAQDLDRLAGAVETTHHRVESAVRHVHDHNDGAAVEAFVARFRSSGGDLDEIDRFREACAEAAASCRLCAELVATMKLAVIFQLSLAATALAAGPSAAALREPLRLAISWTIDQVAERVLAEVPDPA